MLVAVDRTSKAAFAELQPKAIKAIAAEFLRRVIAALPYTAHAILTDNGTQFGNMPHQRWTYQHIFDCVCAEHDS